MEETARRYSPECFQGVEIVESIEDVVKRHKQKIHNPWTIAACLKNSKTGAFKILFKQEISDDDIDSVKQGMLLRGMEKEAETLDSPQRFLMHTLLHEISEGLHPSFSETENDRWAFGKMYL